MATRKRKRKKNPAAVELGRIGARARTKKLTAEERSNAARHAVNMRWARVRAGGMNK